MIHISAQGRMGVSSSTYEESMSAKGGSFGAAGGGMAAGAAGDSLVQIKPQRVKLQLRQSEYKIQVKPVKMYPWESHATA